MSQIRESQHEKDDRKVDEKAAWRTEKGERRGRIITGRHRDDNEPKRRRGERIVGIGDDQVEGKRERSARPFSIILVSTNSTRLA